jgi:hypothetical protein
MKNPGRVAAAAARVGALNPSWKGEEASYGTIHDRLYRRGPARDHACVDCGEQAEQRSYDGADPDERIDPATGMTFSLNLNDYEPRCADCHAAKDAGLRRVQEKRRSHAKLTDAQVAEVKALYMSESRDRRTGNQHGDSGRQWTQDALAARYGVSRKVISRIVRGAR